MLDDDELLYRRVLPEQLTRDPLAALGWRVSSQEWDDPSDDPSVYSARLLGAGGGDLVLWGHAGYTLVEITVGEVRLASSKQVERGISLDVLHRPDPDDEVKERGSAHCAIVGYPDKNSERRIARKPLAQRCRITRLGHTPVE